MLPPGSPALNRDEALELLAQLKTARRIEKTSVDPAQV
jgi:hypothetical protein